MGKRYYCEYCDRAFQDNLNARKKHLRSTVHLRNRDQWYKNFKDPLQILKENIAKKPCNKFIATGNCPFGDRCKYRHMREEDVTRLKEEVERDVKAPVLAPADDIIRKWLLKREKLQQIGDGEEEQKEETNEEMLPILPVELQSEASLPPSLIPPPLEGWSFKCDDLSEWG